LSLRTLVTIVISLVVLAVLVPAAIALAGISVDAQRWREPIATALSRALGREVRLEGPARLVLSFRPDLIVRDVRISNPAGFDAPDFARIAELRLATDLIPLLRNELIVRELRGREVMVRLERSSEGRGNWIFEPGAPGPTDEQARPFRVDWRRIAVEQAQIEYVGADGTRRFELEALTVDGLTGQPVHLTLRGKLGQGRTYTVKATGARLAELAAERPWPFDARFESPAVVVSISGTSAARSGGLALRLAIDARTADVREVERLLDVKLPSTGTAEIAGELDFSPGLAALTSLKGRIGTIAFAGELALDLARQRPLLTGQLAIPDLDLRSFSFSSGGAATQEAATLADAYRSFESAELDLEWMARLDTELQLGIGRVTGMPGEVRDFSASLRVQSGRLAAPLAVTFAGARFDGDLSVDGTTAPPRLRARIVAREAPIAGLAELVFDAPYLAGSVRRFEVMLNARGNRLGELARDLEGRVAIEDARFSYGNYAGGRPVAMRLDAASVTQPRGHTIAGNLRGSLRGKTFDGTFRAGTVERILRERRTPFGFDGSSGEVRARLSGTLAEPADNSGPEITFDITAPRARELTPWLGFSSDSEARVALKGTVQVRQGHAALNGATLLVGRTSITGNAAWQSVGGKALVKTNLVAELLAPAELRALTTSAATAQRATVLEIPILPESLDFADSDVELRVKQVVGLPLEITDVVLQGRMRGGEITPSPFSLRVEGSYLTGTLALDARGASPATTLTLAGDDFDAGALLRRLRVARDVDARIGKLRIHADIRERRLGDVLEQSSFVARIESGTLAFRDTHTRAALRIAVAAGEVRADAGAPVRASITGAMGDTPITLELQAGRLREFVEPGARLPFSLTAQTPAAKLTLSGAAAPQRVPDVALSLALTGERLSALNTLLGTSLPPWGPYALSARLRVANRGYEMVALRLVLGKSVLDGSGALDTTLPRPKLDISLSAERIQLDDFPLGEWSPFEQRAGPASPLTVQSTRKAVAGGAQRVHALLGRELLQLGDANVDVVVKQVVSGKDELGRGRLAVTVANGRATIGPIEVESRGGSARGSLTLEPREHDVVFGARARVDRFDYGVIQRRFNPGSSALGTLSLDLSLDATAPRPSGVLSTGSGQIDIAVWPERQGWGVFDLWAANLLRSLLPFFSTSESLVNCIVGHFDLNQGQLSSRRLVIDTTSTRVAGRADANFASERVEVRLVPSHKRPRLFSLATPVEVRGTFDNYRITLRPADFLGTVWQGVMSLVTVPMSWFGAERIPADGHDVCTNPGR
jgi:hypothetical protein